ncbi:MAG TPA: 50S ribosomal protein L9 [Acidimicrobiales bacterium]|jgi:large subunit ribosomal protein L9|nr:50S ribosomal protein L9 [Acidimicrobiales bacterium]
MRLILRAAVDGVGKKGDVVDVTDGFGRNFLIPKGLAMTATKGAEEQAARMRRARDVKDASDRAAAEQIASQLVPKVITVAARAGSEGKLFGSITTSEVADAVQEQTGIELDRRLLHIDDAIKSVGTHLVPAKLHADVEFPITIEVVAS